MTDAKTVEGENLNSLMAKYVRINGTIRDIEEQKDMLKTKIMVLIKTNGIESYEDDDGNVLSYKKQSRTTFDKEKISKFCEDTGQDISFFQKTDYSEVLRIGKGRGDY